MSKKINGQSGLVTPSCGLFGCSTGKNKVCSCLTFKESPDTEYEEEWIVPREVQEK